MFAEHPHLRGAVLFANELLNSHTEQDAKRLHTSEWRRHVGNGKPFTPEQFSDSFKQRLFMDTVEDILRSLHPKDAYIAREHYGFGGELESNMNIADQLRTTPVTVKNRLERVNKHLLKTTKSHLLAFRLEEQSEDLAEYLLELEPIYPYRKDEKYWLDGRLTSLKP